MHVFIFLYRIGLTVRFIIRVAYSSTDVSGKKAPNMAKYLS